MLNRESVRIFGKSKNILTRSRIEFVVALHGDGNPFLGWALRKTDQCHVNVLLINLQKYTVDMLNGLVPQVPGVFKYSKRLHVSFEWGARQIIDVREVNFQEPLISPHRPIDLFTLLTQCFGYPFLTFLSEFSLFHCQIYFCR